MSLAFNPMQRRYLDALGYTRYELAGSQPEAPASLSKPASGDTVDTRDARLFAAVIRAARAQLDAAADPGSWLRARGVDSISSLRDNPAAKRTLWITLRRERRIP